MLALSTLQWVGNLVIPASGWIWASMGLAVLALVGMIRAFTLRRPYRAIPNASKLPDNVPDKLNQEAEQAGTGQPATRPESKSEGSYKLQPEAEGRSR